MNVLSIFQKQLVGLDIGVSGIKAVELSGNRNPRLTAYNRLPLPWDTISADGEVKNRGVLVGALRKLFEVSTFGSKRVAVGASGTAIITRKISVPKMTVNDLKHQLFWEAEQYIPFNVEEVNLDFAIVGNNSQTQSGSPMMDVLLVAAKKDYVNALTSIIKEAGLIPAVVDNQAFSLGNVFEFNYGHLIDANSTGNTNVIIDFGAGSTKISIVEGDKTTFTRELRQSGIGLTELLSERLNLPIDQAERVKILEGTNAPVRALIDEYTHALAEEISRTLDFFLSQGSDRTIQGIYICGGGSRAEGLTEALESKLTAPVQPLNPIQNIAGSGKMMNAQAIRELAYLGAVAIGLSLRRTGDAA